MAGTALPGGDCSRDERVRLVTEVSRVAWVLFGRAFNSVNASVRLTVDQADDMSIDERVAASDREAIYDAIVEARDVLDGLRESIGTLLVESADTLDRLNEVRLRKERRGSAPPMQLRAKEAPRTDAVGKVRQRSR